MRTILILCCLWGCISAKPISVVVVGGGPAGLAAAIAAQQEGAHAVVVEKRSHYSRCQIVFLYEDSLALLRRWSVEVPEMFLCISEQGTTGIVQIRDLEEGLAKRASELGIAKLYGTFKNICEHHCVIALVEDGMITVPFDLLIGADGMNSHVRKALGIGTSTSGTASGTIAILNVQNVEAFHSEIEQWGSLYIRKVTFPPHTSLLLAHSPFSCRLTQEQLGTVVQRWGWEAEAAILKEEKAAAFFSNIPISLQQADRFSDPQQKALLIGDAAAVASFFQCLGVDVALQTAAAAGKCVKALQQDESQAFEWFDVSMEELTGSMIDDSRYLFSAQTP